MKSQEEIIKQLEDIARKDKRYKADAYIFVLSALNFTIESLKREGHVSGRELLEGIKSFAMKEYGRMAKTVFEHWGVTKTEDFGNIVFTLVDNKLLGKTDQDNINDFKDIYDFKKIFEDEYKY